MPELWDLISTRGRRGVLIPLAARFGVGTITYLVKAGSIGGWGRQGPQNVMLALA
jgi:hypothetical protein